jgi:predicted lipoprotein with Yx(FWY)xxD motif
MRRQLIIGLVGLAVVAGCGESEADEPAAADAGEATVSVGAADGLGDVLVDAGGAVLYTSEQEADGRIRCVTDCLGFWQPLTAPANGDPRAGDGVDGVLGVAERDDGTQQVTYDGVPLYRFSEDGPGEATGDGLQDAFGGTTFTWQAVTIGGMDAGTGGTGPGGYGP